MFKRLLLQKQRVFLRDFCTREYRFFFKNKDNSSLVTGINYQRTASISNVTLYSDEQILHFFANHIRVPNSYPYIFNLTNKNFHFAQL